MRHNMYKKSVEYYQDPSKKSPIEYSHYVGPKFVPHTSFQSSVFKCIL